MIRLSPDQVVLWDFHGWQLNATIAFTWLVMAILVVASGLITRHLTVEDHISRWQNLLEVIVTAIRDQIRSIAQDDTKQDDTKEGAKPSVKDIATRYIPFVGTLFLFIALSNILTIIPFYHPPTGSLSTTAALAACVLAAAPIFGIAERGFWSYLKGYTQPSIFMLPFNIIGEISRTIALAVRLYGNVMSGTIIVGILISVTPLFFPAIMRLFGLLTGLIQAYIFAVLAMVYIASAARSQPSAGTIRAEPQPNAGRS
jgi:F-type H+-transporting ATPase subunit a